jgi:hypothetical protein
MEASFQNFAKRKWIKYANATATPQHTPHIRGAGFAGQDGRNTTLQLRRAFFNFVGDKC